jgi:type IV pilus assembly protein PilA
MRNQQGFSLIELLIAVVLIAIIAALAIPSLLQSRRAANEASAIQSLRTIASAENAYFSALGSSAKYGTLDQLHAAGLVDSSLTGAGFTKSGYAFTHSVSTPSDRYCADALPGVGEGVRVFGTDRNSSILQDLTDPTPCENGVLDTAGGTALRS